jgi:hypothetical protein
VSSNAEPTGYATRTIFASKSSPLAVEGFLDSEDGAKWRKQQESDVPTDADDLEFWEYHLEI